MALLKVAISVGGYDQSGMGTVAEYVQAAESMGVHCAWSAEAWGRDAATALAFLAAKTDRIMLGTGIMQISARVPSMTAMTALSLQSLSNGRFILGLGVSGPQVVEGLQGQDYRKPLTRLRETVDVIKMALRGEKIRYDGETITLPRPGGEGKAIRLDWPPTEIPIYLATLGPKSLEYTGEAADGWLGTSFSPDHPEAHLKFIRAGAEKAGRSMSDIHLNAACSVGIGEDVEALIDARRPGIAFQMGAMGSEKTNFYNEAFQRAGFQDEALEIQRLWIEGKRDEAAKVVPDAMITEFGAVGTPEMVRERFKTFAEVGVSGITVRFDTSLGIDGQLKQLEKVMELVD
jgi:F420-dependent oxidoreductase-like protein